MSKEIAYAGQSFLDKIVECTGDIENAFSMMLLNGVTLTEELQVGMILKKSPITDYDVVDFYTENNKPATSIAVKRSADLAFDYSFPGEFPFSF